MTEDITEALQREIPTLYLDRADDAYYVAEAIIASDWLAAHDSQVAARTWREGAVAILRSNGVESVDRYLENLAENGHANPYLADGGA